MLLIESQLSTIFDLDSNSLKQLLCHVWASDSKIRVAQSRRNADALLAIGGREADANH